MDASKFGDFTTTDHMNIQRHIDTNFKNITPADEYKDFSEKYKSLPVIFRFDDNPIDDKDVGKLQPNQLTVDNLTVEWLRQRIIDLELQVKDYQDKQQKIQNESNGKISSSTASLPIIPSNNNSVNGSHTSLKDTK